MNGGAPVADQRSCLKGPQSSCSPLENHSNGFQHCSAQERMLNGDLKTAQGVIAFRDDLDFHTQEAGELNDKGDSSNSLKLELEILENHLNRRCSSVGSSGDDLPDSNSSSPSRRPRGLPKRSSYSDKHTQRLEAKCRAMDTFNQHLQASLDTAGRFLRSAKRRSGDFSGLCSWSIFLLYLLQPEKASGWRPRCRSWRLRTRACRPLWRSCVSLHAA